MKRIRNKRKAEPEQNVSSGYTRLRRRNSRNSQSQSVDTLHPKALTRNRQIICKDIQEQMNKIMIQGEVIKKHLVQLKVIIT